MGENAVWLAFGTPKKLAETAMSGIAGQLEVMMAFVRKRGLLDELRDHNWEGFARLYNGTGQVEFYSTKMAQAHRRITGGAAPAPRASTSSTTLRSGAKGEAVATLQRQLRALGYFLIVDDDFGPAPLRASRCFRPKTIWWPMALPGRKPWPGSQRSAPDLAHRSHYLTTMLGDTTSSPSALPTAK